MEKNSTELLLKDVENPKFYDNIADISSVVLYQGVHFVVKPHYERQEQIMCSVDGTISLALVPHIYRQELYTDELHDSMYFDKRMREIDQSNVASVNFFVPKLEKYPYFENVQKFNVNLKTGDCVFIPSYFFYQMQGNNQNITPMMFSNLTRSIFNKTAMEDYKAN